MRGGDLTVGDNVAWWIDGGWPALSQSGGSVTLWKVRGSGI